MDGGMEGGEGGRPAGRQTDSPQLLTFTTGPEHIEAGEA